MTKVELKMKVKEMLRDDKKFIIKLIDKAIQSGCMDIEGAEENSYLLPKMLLCAIYKEMADQRAPLNDNAKNRKMVENIGLFL